LYELAPLNSEEVRKIVGLSGIDPDRFLNALLSTPYSDLADRPLFLTQLLLIFQKYDYLPKQPSEVYRLITLLSLREWDAERGLARTSKYTDFSPDRKLLFLAAISYHLTFRIKQKVFSSNDLHRAYSQVCSRFDLPSNQASAVVAEVESHTGLIVASGHSEFEFCHLSLQEYLAAEYISRETHGIHLRDYLDQYTAPVAISIALASDPSIAFASLFLRGGMPDFKVSHSFLHRLVLEVPIFDVTPALGVAALRVFTDLSSGADGCALVGKLLALPGMKASAIRALGMYRQIAQPEGNPSSGIKIKRFTSLDIYHGLKTPDSLTFDSAVFASIVESLGVEPDVMDAPPPQPKRKKRRNN
jgi:hypothetical protein